MFLQTQFVIARFNQAVHASVAQALHVAGSTPRLNRGVTLVFGAVLCAFPALAIDVPTDTAVLRALDKVTARVQTLRVPVGQPVTFARLEILVKTCMARPPEETPESSALLQVMKTAGKDKRTKIFEGWMFASSPDLSAMDDPVYDIWVLSCENSVASSSPAASGGPK